MTPHPPTDHAWQAAVLERWAHLHRIQSLAVLLTQHPEVFAKLAELYRAHHPVAPESPPMSRAPA